MTHTAEDVVSIAANTPVKAVDDYSVVPRGDADRPAVYASGDLYTFLATTRETDFDFNFFDFFLPVNGGPPPHYHPFENETWHVTDGEFQFNIGDLDLSDPNNPATEINLVVPEGTTVFGPRDRFHGYRNLDSEASVIGVTPGARTLSMTTPGSLDLFFEAAATRVVDRDDPIPTFSGPTPQDFINLAKFAARTDAGILLGQLDPDYEPPEEALDYVVVLPDDASEDLIDQARSLVGTEGLSIWSTAEVEGIPQRPTSVGEFGIEYTSLVNFEESGGEFSYNQFSLTPQPTDSFVQANLNAEQVVPPTNSSATGVATLNLNEDGSIEYELTVTGLDLGEFSEGGNPQTEEEQDDVTAIHIHAGERGSNGEHIFEIIDPEEQDDDYTLTFNQDGTATVNGLWEETETSIPSDLIDFFGDGGSPGEDADYYFQIHTEGNPDGEIRGQVALTPEDFPEPEVSEDHQLFYVNEGTLSLAVNGEVETVGKDTFAYVAPGNEYAIANFNDTNVESLAITVEDIASPSSPEEVFESPISAESSVLPQRIEFLDNEGNFFRESDNPNSYRYLFDAAPGFTDYVEDPVTVDGIEFDGTFVNAAINPGTGELAFANGTYRVPIGSLGEPNSLVETYREDYRVAGFEDGVIGQYFLDSSESLDTVPDTVELLPDYYQEGLAPEFVAVLPFDNPPDVYDYAVIPSETFAFDVFRDEAGNPAPIVGEGYSVETFESRRRIYGDEGDDELYAKKEDRFFGEEGNDILDASNGFGSNRLYGGLGEDEILVNVNDRAFGGDGDDLIDSSVGVGQPGAIVSGGNYLSGDNGNDTLIAGSLDELHGGNGEDILKVRRGGENLLYGGADADQFWIADGTIPDTVPVEYPEGTEEELLPEGFSLPDLVDTRNTIMDFELGVDKIHIRGLETVATTFDDLELLPAFGDRGSTSIIASFSEDGVETEVSLANVAGVIFNELSASDFVFV